jgi:hypothetical protein
MVARDRKEKVSKTFILKNYPTGWGHEPTEWHVLKLERYAKEGRTSIPIPLELRFDRFGM